MRSALILLAVLLVSGCDDPLSPSIDGELTVDSITGYRLESGKYVNLLGHQKAGSTYVCQVSLEVASNVEYHDLFACNWRLLDRDVYEIEWDEALLS